MAWSLLKVHGLYSNIGFSSGAKDTCRLTTIPCWVARAAHVRPGGPNTVCLYEASLHGTVKVGLQGCCLRPSFHRWAPIWRLHTPPVCHCSSAMMSA